VTAPVERGVSAGDRSGGGAGVGGGARASQPWTGRPQQRRCAGLSDTTLWPAEVRGVSGGRLNADEMSDFLTWSLDLPA
jgi:hypothetical protein